MRSQHGAGALEWRGLGHEQDGCLVRHFGDIDVAEEAVQDAFTVAVQRWPSAGLSPSPVGWIITAARNRAIDRLRREASREDRHAEAALLYPSSEPAEEAAVPDAALSLLGGLDLDDYHLFHAIRADLLRRVGRKDEAALAYAAAIARTDNARERDFLQRSLLSVGGQRGERPAPGD